MPRFTPYCSDDFLARVVSLYRNLVPPNSTVLDLCGSWDSHLPQNVAYNRVEGLGMNEGELKANWRLDGYLVQDLNVNPYLP